MHLCIAPCPEPRPTTPHSWKPPNAPAGPRERMAGVCERVDGEVPRGKRDWGTLGMETIIPRLFVGHPRWPEQDAALPSVHVSFPKETREKVAHDPGYPPSP